MSLLQLSDELLCIIGRFLSCYRDVRALVLSNCRLNSIFAAILPTHRVKNCHGSLLSCAAHSPDIGLLAEILDRLAVMNKERNEVASSRTVQQTGNTRNDNSYDEKDAARLWDGSLHPDIKDHPLYAAGYRLRDILSIQRAFLAAIPTGSKELVTYFLDHGPVRRLDLPRGKDPLPLTLAVKHGYDEIFDILISDHAAHTCDSDDCPIVEAVKRHHFRMIRALLEVGVDDGVTIEKYGHMALSSAIIEGKKEWVKFLISKGADPSLSDCLSTDIVIDDGTRKYSSIYHAILHGKLEICKFLIASGVRPEEDDLQLAREKGYDEIVDILSDFSYTNVPEKEDLVTRWINTHI
ncbi:ankyrin repeat protein [Aspergillus floccosus]